VSYVLLLIVGVTLGATLSHASALKTMQHSIETDFAAIRAYLKILSDTGRGGSNL
jgi:hypothetical protein